MGMWSGLHVTPAAVSILVACVNVHMYIRFLLIYYYAYTLHSKNINKAAILLPYLTLEPGTRWEGSNRKAKKHNTTRLKQLFFKEKLAASGGTRTHDQLYRRCSYQLSYWGSSACWARTLHTNHLITGELKLLVYMYVIHVCYVNSVVYVTCHALVLVYVTLATGRVKHWLVVSTIVFPLMTLHPLNFKSRLLLCTYNL